MFKEIRIKNFRTHIDTTLELGPITLLIGPNNAGKTNLLAGINHFARLASRSKPGQPIPYKLRSSDFFPHRHRLAPDGMPMAFSCTWTHKQGDVEYEIELLECEGSEQHVGCRELVKIKCRDSLDFKEVHSGKDNPSESLQSQRGVELSEDLTEQEKKLGYDFFRDLGGVHSFQFQAAFLNGSVAEKEAWKDPNVLRIASHIGSRGDHMQRILHLVKEQEERTFNSFVASLRRFENSFHGLGYDEEKGQAVWMFDLGRIPPRADEFPPDVVSDGLLRAAAIALLSSMRKPPALLMIEEIENGISQRNLGRFWGWLQQAAGLPDSTERGYNTQFLLTSHSPSILLEISKHLDDVFHMRLQRRGYRSVVSNLNSALLGFFELGYVEGEVEERDGKRVVKLSPQELMNLWFSGVIGGEPINGPNQ